jgi:hypothetical protein
MFFVAEYRHVGPDEHAYVLKSPQEVAIKAILFGGTAVGDISLYLGVREGRQAFHGHTQG